MLQAQRELRKLGSPAKARFAQRFFRTGPGEYGEGDQFLGVTVPQVRAVAKQVSDLSPVHLKKLLNSPIHEDRLLALVILVDRFRREPQRRPELHRFYLRHRAGVNNWDLVDTSAATLVGLFCIEHKDPTVIDRLARSPRHWDRRIAMVASFAYIREGRLGLTYRLAKMFLQEREDLMHKATGWMLREAGKRDGTSLRRFIQQNGKRMPRTMLRYAIEHFSVGERRQILQATRKK